MEQIKQLPSIPLKMMLHKINTLALCRLCGKEQHQGTDLFKDKVKGSVLISIINKYFAKEIINICITDIFSKYVCSECEQKLCMFDEFCLMVANVQKQLTAPSLEIDFAEDMLCHLKEASLQDKLTEPMLNTNEKRKQVCPICGKSFRCLAHLKRHKLIHTGQRPYICDICSMSFNQQEIMMKHKLRHEIKKMFQCANCHQSFRYKVSLKSHMINFHAMNNQMIVNNQIVPLQNQPLQCTECGKQFATKYKLQRHRRCHTGEKPFLCNYCDRSFSQTGNLKLHQMKYHQMACTMPDTQENLQLQQAPAQVIQQEMPNPLNTYQPVFLTETEIQNTINETINSTDPSSSYLNKSYENPLYIDEEIETMLDQDLDQLERQKYVASTQEKVSFCLKQPETPELLQSLLYDD